MLPGCLDLSSPYRASWRLLYLPYNCTQAAIHHLIVIGAQPLQPHAEYSLRWSALSWGENDDLQIRPTSGPESCTAIYPNNQFGPAWQTANSQVTGNSSHRCTLLPHLFGSVLLTLSAGCSHVDCWLHHVDSITLMQLHSISQIEQGPECLGGHFLTPSTSLQCRITPAAEMC